MKTITAIPVLLVIAGVGIAFAGNREAEELKAGDRKFRQRFREV
jgi:hypothetical protein